MSEQVSTSPVHMRLDGEVLVVRIANPPVNALGQAVRAGLQAAVERLEQDASARAMLIVGEGKAFIAGADIREFGKPPQAPFLPEVINRMEAAGKLVVAAIHGPALGGGLEVAMATHYRLALPGAKLGLPEVSLGLLPGAGGTQRSPRLMGALPAAELMLSGKHLSAKAALAAGLVDKLVESDDPVAAGLACVRELLASGAPIRRTSALPVPGDQAEALAALDKLSQDTAKKTRGLFSPGKIIDCVKVAVQTPFAEGSQRERAMFLECLNSPQRAGLVHAFFSERETAKIPEAKAAAPRPFTKLSIIGGGTMGAGITVAALDAGLSVVMIERDAESIARGQKNVEKVYDGLIAKGRMTAEAKAATMARYTPSTSYDDIKDVDMVIEAVFEDLEVKKAVFKELDRVCKPGAVLATNTSYLDIDAIAAVTRRPQDVIGLHFFSPANIMRLLEIVVPSKVAADVVVTAFELAKRMKKVPVRAGVCDGFIGNRILSVYREAANHVLEDGASPYEIDAAVREFGYPMGPFQVSDLAGGDIGWATRKRKAATRDPQARYVEIADRIAERGWFGQKTGRGWYLYPEGARVGQQDPEVLAIVDAERAKKGITPRAFTHEEIMRRYMAAMVNEGARVLEEGIALRPLDIDVTFLFGYGFPRHRGGPMLWADMQGLPKVLADIEEFAQEDAQFWQPAALLKKLVAEGKNFASLN
ncbi:MAG: enoyl-CoA hydratase/isomerase family protein [Comamonadaceae bacterium]|nr:enoyl-CoA hydratase/isomerase family protein [Comamonadaceae bacterium]